MPIAGSIRRRASQRSSGHEAEGILDREAGTVSPTGYLLCAIWGRVCRDRPRRIKTQFKSGAACAIPFGGTDPVDIGSDIGTSAQRRQKHDKVAPTRLRSAGTFAQTDRSGHDLAAATRQSTCASMVARPHPSGDRRIERRRVARARDGGLERTRRSD